MPSAVSPNPRAGSQAPDDLDNLLDYDNAVEDFMRDLPVGSDNQNNNAATAELARDEDQEVQVKKKRNPVPKLDENRLLSDAGIPKLRKITKTRLKFRGKGHEFADISRLLNTYQLWLDDLYPRAKFRDALTMVEKVGHSKRMQVMRKAWLDDTKPYGKELTPEGDLPGVNEGADNPRIERESSLFGDTTANSLANDNSAGEVGNGNAPDDDELDAMLAEDDMINKDRTEKYPSKRRGPFEEEDDEDEDELDALMAENTVPTTSDEPENRVQKQISENEPDDDELDALMAEQTEPNVTPKPQTGNPSGSNSQGHTDNFADDEEALASMGGMW